MLPSSKEDGLSRSKREIILLNICSCLMGVHSSLSVHMSPSAQPIIDKSGNFLVHLSADSLKRHIGCLGTSMTAHFYFCPPTIAFLGSVRTFFQCNPNIFVTYEPMQNFKSIAQTLLGEIAHFGYCLAEIVFAVWGYGGSKYLFSI